MWVYDVPRSSPVRKAWTVNPEATPVHPVLAFVMRLPKKLLVLVPASMLAGLAAGYFADLSPLKSLILPLVQVPRNAW